MTKDKHTPGPWEISEYFDNGNIDIRSEDQEICLLRSEVRHTLKANAALIAAAPEMLEALETLLNLVLISEENHHLIDRIEILLKKARGEQYEK